MNRFFQKLLFILITAVVMTAGVVVVVAVNNRGAAPVLWLKMDEGYGSTTADTSGYSNNGIIVAGYWKNESDCKQGKCLYFDGSDDYLNCGNGATLDFSQYVTVEAWVKPASLLGAGQYNNIVSFEGSNMALMLTDSGKVGFWLQDNSPGNWHYILTDNAETATDSWYHIAAAYDGSRQRLYINGVEKKTGSVDSFTINTLNQALYIGNTGGELNRPFGGYLDDIRIYNYARSAIQVKADYLKSAGGKGATMKVDSAAGSSSIAYWPFDEGYGTVAYDKSGDKNDGVISGADWTTAGKFGKALNFVLANFDYINIGVNKFLYDEVSISFWANNIGKAGNAPWPHYFVTRESDSDACGIGYDNNDSKKIDVYCYKPGSGINQLIYGHKSMDGDIGWHHIVAIFSGVGGMKLYVDGVLSASEASYTASFDDLSSTNSYIGRGRVGIAEEYVNGTIDEFKIYPFVLSPAAIKAEYNRGASLKFSGAGTDSLGNPSDSASSTYCVPGDTSYCVPPVLHIKMDEGTGQTIFDTSGTGNNGALGDTASPESVDPTWKISGCKQGSCLKFDGNSDHVKVPYNSSFAFGDHDYTVEAWINHNGSNAAATYRGIVLQTDSYPNGYCLRLGPSADPTAHKLFFFYGDDDSWEEYTGTTTLVVGRWYHVAAVYTASTNRVQLYVNGVPEGSRSSGDSGNQQADTNAPLYIGEDWLATNRFFNGMIDDVRIYNYARTVAQINWDKDYGKPIAWWRMNDGQNSSTTCDSTNSGVIDQSGNGNHGFLYLGGSPATSAAWVEGRYGCALDFDGSNDYVSVYDQTLWDLGGQISVSAWVKPESSCEGDAIAVHDLSSYKWLLYCYGIGQANPYFFVTTASGAQYAASPIDMNDGNWHHMVGTFDKNLSSNRIKLYIDGRLAGQDPGSAQDILFGDEGVYIGSAYNSLSNGFNGMIDDVRVYSYALTVQQVRMLYNEGSSVRFGPSSGLP